jgi:hypothetical protein
MTLHSACWKYDLDTSDYSYEEWLEYSSSRHIHIGLFNLIDTFAVVEMEVSPQGVWQLKTSIPRLETVSARSLFQDVKKEIRDEIKQYEHVHYGNACTESKITKSFFHLVHNQHVDLYDPTRDGVSQY